MKRRAHKPELWKFLVPLVCLLIIASAANMFFQIKTSEETFGIFGATPRYNEPVQPVTEPITEPTTTGTIGTTVTNEYQASMGRCSEWIMSPGCDSFPNENGCQCQCDFVDGAVQIKTCSCGESSG